MRDLQCSIQTVMLLPISVIRNPKTLTGYSTGMDINIDNTDGQYLEYNIIGGVLDFYFLAGPTPVEVAQQYSEVVGKSALMPYWGFGFHQCRYGMRDVYEVAEVVANYSAANIPLETMWTDSKSAQDIYAEHTPLTTCS